MDYSEDEDNLRTFLDLISSIYVIDDDFDVYCCYEYFNNHSQQCTSVTECIQQYEFVILTLKTVISHNYHTSISGKYIVDLIRYINGCEYEKNWCCLLYSMYCFPPRKYYLETIKYELVQYNVLDSMYILLLRCMNFDEKDVNRCMDVARYFFMGCIDREISIRPRIKWKFGGGSYVNIFWVIAIPKGVMDNFTGFRRNLINENWNDFYSGPEWRTYQLKKKSLMDYMKTLTGYTPSKPTTDVFNGPVRRKKSFFEVDDTVFMKFSEDKEAASRRCVYCILSLVILSLLTVGVLWFIYHQFLHNISLVSYKHAILSFLPFRQLHPQHHQNVSRSVESLLCSMTERDSPRTLLAVVPAPTLQESCTA